MKVQGAGIAADLVKILIAVLAYGILVDPFVERWQDRRAMRQRNVIPEPRHSGVRKIRGSQRTEVGDGNDG